jgi:hypothetical protein
VGHNLKFSHIQPKGGAWRLRATGEGESKRRTLEAKRTSELPFVIGLTRGWSTGIPGLTCSARSGDSVAGPPGPEETFLYDHRIAMHQEEVQVWQACSAQLCLK